MTRKHFRQLAEIVKNGDPSYAPYLARQLGKVCEKSNPNFDWRFFYDACGVSLDYL